MAEERADPRRRSEHRGNARHHLDLQRPPFRLALVDRLEHRARHGEHAGIAGRDHRHRPALRRQGQRQTGAVQLLPIIGGVPDLPRFLRHAVHIR